MLNALIIGHGDFAQGMLSTAESIVGKQPFVKVLSNIGLSCKQLDEKINKIIKQNKKYKTLIFVDLPGGSCTISCFNVLKNNRGLNIICGVNLPMLLEFFILRNKYSVREIIPVLIKKGKENIYRLNG